MQFRNDLIRVNSTKLARLLGVQRATIWRWKNGLSRPTRRHRLQVERVLGEFVSLVLPESQRTP
jgi:transcriptional regulator with XRE-family HTH domain